MTDQRKQVMNRNTIWLRRVGLIVGIAGIIEIIIWGVFNSEGGPSWDALIPALVSSIMFCVPLIAGLIISWKWPFLGGIALIVIAIMIFIGFMVTYLGRPVINPITELLMYAGIGFSCIGLPYLLPGILFTLSSKRSSNNRQATA